VWMALTRFVRNQVPLPTGGVDSHSSTRLIAASDDTGLVKHH
jgi:hypothetical protein